MDDMVVESLLLKPQVHMQLKSVMPHLIVACTHTIIDQGKDEAANSYHWAQPRRPNISKRQSY